MQLQTLWGLSQNQTAEFTSNWNELYWTQYNNLTNTTNINPYMTPSNNTDMNEFSVAYWQWVNSTYSQNLGGYNSWKNVANVVSNQFPGCFELQYFKSNCFYYGASSNNIAYFANVNLWNATDPASSYPHLIM